MSAIQRRGKVTADVADRDRARVGRTHIPSAAAITAAVNTFVMVMCGSNRWLCAGSLTAACQCGRREFPHGRLPGSHRTTEGLRSTPGRSLLSPRSASTSSELPADAHGHTSGRWECGVLFQRLAPSKLADGVVGESTPSVSAFARCRRCPVMSVREANQEEKVRRVG
jgi:hypothetical protein